MSDVTVSGLHEFFCGEMYATVELSKSGDGYVAEFFCSRILRESYELQLLGYVRIPVFGENVSDALRRLSFIYESVMDSLASWSGGVGQIGTGGDTASARKHCKAHLQVWGAELVSEDKVQRIATLYSFAIEYGVSNPAALIAEVEVLPSVRTVHDRIAYARRIGLLDSYGKGRVRNDNNTGTSERSGSNGAGSGSVAEETEWVGDGDADSGGSPDESEERTRSVIDRIFRHSGLTE